MKITKNRSENIEKSILDNEEESYERGRSLKTNENLSFQTPERRRSESRSTNALIKSDGLHNIFQLSPIFLKNSPITRGMGTASFSAISPAQQQNLRKKSFDWKPRSPFYPHTLPPFDLSYTLNNNSSFFENEHSSNDSTGKLEKTETLHKDQLDEKTETLHKDQLDEENEGKQSENLDEFSEEDSEALNSIKSTKSDRRENKDSEWGRFLLFLIVVFTFLTTCFLVKYFFFTKEKSENEKDFQN